MKSFVFLNLLLMLMSTCFAATSMGYYKDPKHPNKCVIKPDLILSPGQIVKDPDMQCGRIICGLEGLANFHTCGVIGVKDDCSVGDYIDVERDYPDCCERKIVCA